MCAAADLVRVDENGRPIYGVVYEIPMDNVDREIGPDLTATLDFYEGRNYERVPVRLSWLDGSPVLEMTQTYLVKEKQFDIKTSLGYVTHILTGLVEHPFPQEYVEFVLKQIELNNPELKVNELKKQMQ